MPIVNVANHFIETNGNPVDPDTINQSKNRRDYNESVITADNSYHNAKDKKSI